MGKAALVLVGLYAALLVVLTVPVVLVCFAPEAKLGELLAIFGFWPYWVWLALMLLSEAALLALPVRVASGRPVARRTIWAPIIAAGFLMACLALGSACALVEFLQPKAAFKNDWQVWTVLGACLLLWLGWTLLFIRVARRAPATDVLTRQCRALMQGSVLALLVAVPTHIVVRQRHECCGGFYTFLGIACGLSVMLLAFGPGVLALYVARWRARHPAATTASETKG